jgi:hypothetical protein
LRVKFSAHAILEDTLKAQQELGFTRRLAMEENGQSLHVLYPERLTIASSPPTAETFERSDSLPPMHETKHLHLKGRAARVYIFKHPSLVFM